MKDFDWTSFTKRIAIHARMPEIYTAWTTAVGLEKWFLEKVVITRKGVALASNDGVIEDDGYSWKWYLYQDAMEGKFTAANGIDFIQFTFEGNCLVDVSLTQQDEYVVVTLKQYNIPTDAHAMQHVRLGCTNGWTFYLTNLKSVYEGGLDLRNKDAAIGGMLNN